MSNDNSPQPTALEAVGSSFEERNKNIIGSTYGKLTVTRYGGIRRIPSGKNTQTWVVKCCCGQEKRVEHYNLISGRTRGCNHCKSQPRVENSPNWKGGRRLKKDKYVSAWTGELDEYGRAIYRLEHHIVMSNHIGRNIKPEETVHHKNGIKSDNRIENLELWASRHCKGQRVTDLVAFAIEILKEYSPEKLKENTIVG